VAAKIQSASSVAGKETIYVDVDDEITAIIDKVGGAKSKIVALVLPKRATVLQSIVNMKLLKRTADNAGKNLVLVTSEAGLIPLAGIVGLHVASTPTSKPSIPAAPASMSDEPEDIDEPLDITDGSLDPEDGDFDSSAVASKTVGELAAAGAASKIAADDIDESIDMTDDVEPAAAAADVATKTPKLKKNKKLSVPNFDSFRKKIALSLVAGILLIIGWIFAFNILPKATVTIATDSSTIGTNLNLTLDTAAKKLDTANSIMPATAQSQQKTSTQQVPATGQQNNGQQAAGTITVTNCSGASVTFQAGSSFSASSHTFIAQNSVTVPDSNYGSPISGSKCKNDGKGTVNVMALRGGADYNLGPATYTPSGNPSGVSAQGSQMSGGTDNITKIVTQSDIDGAASKMKSDDTTVVTQQLVTGLQTKGLQAITTTFAGGVPQVTTSAKAGDAVDTVTVTSVTTYTMLGINKADLKSLVVSNVNSQLDKGRQVILDDGVANAKFTEANPASSTGAAVAVAVKSLAGPQLDALKLKAALAGKKTGDVKSYIGQTPGVTNVAVKYSPFWVGSVPKNASKVTIIIDKKSN
jgi:hypothetical protein